MGDGIYIRHIYEFTLNISSLNILFTQCTEDSVVTFSAIIKDNENQVLCDTANQIWVEGDWEKKIYKLFKSSVTAIKSREIYTHKRLEGLKFNLQYFLHHVVEEVFKNTKTCELLKSFSIADDAIVVGDRIIMAKTESTTKNKVKIVKYIVYDYKSGLNTVLDLDLITENNRTVPVVNSYICGDWIEYLLEYHKSIENKPSEYDHGSKTNKRSGKYHFFLSLTNDY